MARILKLNARRNKMRENWTGPWKKINIIKTLIWKWYAKWKWQQRYEMSSISQTILVAQNYAPHKEIKLLHWIFLPIRHCSRARFSCGCQMLKISAISDIFSLSSDMRQVCYQSFLLIVISQTKLAVQSQMLYRILFPTQALFIVKLSITQLITYKE